MNLRIKVLILLSLLSFSAYTQTIKYVDKAGNETSKRKASLKLIIEEIEGDSIHDKITGITARGKMKVFEGMFMKGAHHIKDGYYKKYFGQGTVSLEENYINNLREGIVFSYHYNGQVYIRTYFVNDKRVGIEKEYDNEGTLVRESNFEEYKIGEETLYYKSGAVKEKNVYKEGRLEGLCKTFYESGEIESEKMYKFNTLHGEAREYFTDGSIYTIYNYQNGLQHGEFHEFYKTGELECSGTMGFGVKNGEFTSYYKSGMKRRYENYVFDKANKEEGRCYTPDGSDTTYFPRLIEPVFNNKEVMVDELLKVVQSNFEYPAYAKKYGIEGLIHVAFVISKDSKIEDIEIVYPNFYEPTLAAEAIRLVKLLGKEDIKNGFFEGKPVSINYTLPIRFKLR